VGATAIACLTGQEPENLPHKGLAIDVRRALGPTRDPRLTSLLERMLDPDPDRRAGDLGRALLETLGPQRTSSPPHSGSKAPKSANPTTAWGPPRRRRHNAFALSILLLVMVSLFLARIATFGLFRVALPLVLGILAVFFGSSLKKAAGRCLEIGEAGEFALRNAARRVGGLEPLRQRRPRRRYRVETPSTLDTEGEAVEDSFDARYDSVEHDIHDERRRRRS
jgi:hypothetical protein